MNKLQLVDASSIPMPMNREATIFLSLDEAQEPKLAFKYRDGTVEYIALSERAIAALLLDRDFFGSVRIESINWHDL